MSRASRAIAESFKNIMSSGESSRGGLLKGAASAKSSRQSVLHTLTAIATQSFNYILLFARESLHRS